MINVSEYATRMFDTDEQDSNRLNFVTLQQMFQFKKLLFPDGKVKQNKKVVELL